MTFKTDRQADMLIFLNVDEFGENITYKPKGGTFNTRKVIVNPLGITEENQQDRKMIVDRRRVVITRDATLGVATATNDDEATIDGLIFKVEEIEDFDENQYTIRFVNFQTKERLKEGHQFER